ncbi:MAG: hypothetical protein KDA32_13285 [Phycisphaerales bacterium]|nr:hypothetical protein [Phycisphaerales bacterium]
MKLRYSLLTTVCALGIIGSCQKVPYFTAPPAAPVFGGFTTLPQSEAPFRVTTFDADGNLHVQASRGGPLEDQTRVNYLAPIGYRRP